MYLNIPKLVTKAHRPSRITFVTHVIFVIWEVNGAAIDASAWESDMPTWATFKALRI